MRTENQKQAARANGAKSRGPITPEGKLASSRNALTHGMLAGTVVLRGESEERFNLLVAALHDELQPQTTVEITLVENMAVARWRQMRIWGMEKANLEHEMRAQAEARFATEDDSTEGDPAEDSATRCALAFRALSDDSRSLELINRYESRYDRQYLRAHRRFLELVDRRTPPPVPAPTPIFQSRDSIVQSRDSNGAGTTQAVPGTVSAKRTRQTLTLMSSNRLAAVACAIILFAFSLIPRVDLRDSPRHEHKWQPARGQQPANGANVAVRRTNSGVAASNRYTTYEDNCAGDHGGGLGVFADTAAGRGEEGNGRRDYPVRLSERAQGTLVSRSFQPEGDRQHDLHGGVAL
jgi:hypothetical protein